jgi:hypothetical protein
MAFQDIRKTRKWLSPEEIRLLVLILIGLAVLLSVNIFAARNLAGGEWLYLRWSGARAFLFEQTEPYGRTVAEEVQQLAYGRTALPDEYRYVLNDPFYIVLLYTPLALFPDFSIVRGLWMLLAESALVSSALFAIRLADWEPPRWLTVALVVFSLLGFFSLQSLISGSPAIFFLFLYLAILLALRSVNDELAGALLCLSAYQWEVGGMFFLFILIAVVANRRWKVLTGFGMSLFVFLIVSFLTYPGWGLPYLRAVLSDWNRGVDLNFNVFALFWFPEIRLPIGWIIALALGVILLVEWVGAVRASYRRIVWTSALSLAVTPLLGFAIFQSNHVVLILPLVVVAALVWERWHRRRIWMSALLLLVAFLAPFGLFIAQLLSKERLYSDLLTLFPPAAAIVGLYWMRWQVVRASRPWIEQVGARP